MDNLSNENKDQSLESGENQVKSNDEPSSESESNDVSKGESSDPCQCPGEPEGASEKEKTEIEKTAGSTSEEPAPGASQPAAAECKKKAVVTSRTLWLCFLGIAAVVALFAWFLNQPLPAPDSGQAGAPVNGLTPVQLKKFYDGKTMFMHKWTVDEGLGPSFNALTCYECHGQPGPVGGEGRDISSTSALTYARRFPGNPKAKRPLREVIQGLTRGDVDLYLERGGPILQRKTLSTENPDMFPFNAQLDFETVPRDAELFSNRHTYPILGDGFIDNIPESDIVYNSMQQAAHYPKLAGRVITAVDRFLEHAGVSRFGWKNQNINLINFTAVAMSNEHDITTYLLHTENTPSYLGLLPSEFAAKIRNRSGPDDRGKSLLTLTYFESLLAPPPRGPVTEEVKNGEKIFKDLRCAVCHQPEARTLPDAFVPDPDSPIPQIRWIKMEPLSNKVFYPYSDFLVHDLGPDLADGIPQEGSKGGEFRTPPLWGLKTRKYFMHDGRTQDLHEAIMMHDGQAAEVRDEYAKISSVDRQSLTAFLRSL